MINEAPTTGDTALPISNVEVQSGNVELQNTTTANNAADDVIVIESDAEEEKFLKEERIATQRRIRGIPRRNKRRRVDTDEEDDEDQSNTEIDDDLLIVDERIRNDNGGVLVDNTAELVDLDNEPIEEDNYMLIIDGEDTQLQQPRTSNNDDDLEIVQERTVNPTVTLMLPGNTSMQIRATSTDRPMRSSFDWQSDVPESRRRMSRRRFQSARRLFFSSDEDNSESEFSNEDSYYPPESRPVFARAPSRFDSRRQLQERLRRRQAHLRDQIRQGESPELTQLRSRIRRYPLNVRSVFDHAQSLNEFETMIESVNPDIWEREQTTLKEIFIAYRAQVRENWVLSNINNRGGNRATHDIGGLGTTANSASRSLIAEYLHRVMQFESHNDYNDHAEEEHTQSIIRMIEERENRERDNKIKRLKEKSKSKQNQLIDKAAHLPKGFSASFSTEPINDIIHIDTNDKIKENDEYEDIAICCLCGVDISCGIPDDFKGISEQDSEVSFESLVQKYGISCPYKSLASPTILDRDLSKRTFVSKCGHTFCGRCYLRISSASEATKSFTRKQLKKLIGPANPAIYGPSVCPAPDCNAKIRAKGRMTEIFF